MADPAPEPPATPPPPEESAPTTHPSPSGGETGTDCDDATLRIVQDETLEALSDAALNCDGTDESTPATDQVESNETGLTPEQTKWVIERIAEGFEESTALVQATKEKALNLYKTIFPPTLPGIEETAAAVLTSAN